MFEFKLPDLGEGIAEGEILKWHVTEGGTVLEDAPLVDVETDKIVLELPRLLNERYAPLGSILSGITCAGAFAAFMSTFSGLLVSMTGALAHDVYGRMLRPQSTPEQRMRMFKFAAVLIGGIAIILGSFVEPLEINFMVGQA